MVVRPIYSYDRNFYTGKLASLDWDKSPGISFVNSKYDVLSTFSIVMLHAGENIVSHKKNKLILHFDVKMI